MKGKLLKLLTLLTIVGTSIAKTFYEIKINDIQDKPMDMEKFKGKVVLIANVASKCGYADKGYQ